jgi:hypothetical protein
MMNNAYGIVDVCLVFLLLLMMYHTHGRIWIEYGFV